MVRTNTGNIRDRKYYARYLTHFAKHYVTLLILGGVFVLGVAAGTLLIRGAAPSVLDLLLRIIGDFAQRRGGQSLYEGFISGAVTNLALLLFLFICGFCAISKPFVVLVPFLRGLGFGFSAASVYAAYGTAAFGFVGVLMLPSAAIGAVLMLFCCRESLRLSDSLFDVLRGEGRQLYPVRVYCARYFACAVGGILLSFLEAVLYVALSARFILG